jgi:hypothetical protein
LIGKELQMINPEQIRPNMTVVGNDGEFVGVVEAVEYGTLLRLMKDQEHHSLPLATVEYVDDRVHLNRKADRALEEWD